jgi:hypothetical protein
MYRALAILGAVLLALGAGLALLLSSAYLKALHLDDSFVLLSLPKCTDIDSTVAVSKRVITESESVSLTIDIVNKSAEECSVIVKVWSADFEISPREEITGVDVTLAPNGGSGKLIKILSPRKMGSFKVVANVNNDVEEIGIVVTNALGLTAFQAQLFSVIASILGPVLTFPWWYEKWKESKKRKRSTSRGKSKKRNKS